MKPCLMPLLIVMSAIAGAADEPPSPELGKAWTSDSIQVEVVEAPSNADHSDLTVLLDNFILTSGHFNEARTKTFTFRKDMKSNTPVNVSLDLEGFVKLNDHGGVAVIVMVGGETSVIDLQKAIEAAKVGESKADVEIDIPPFMCPEISFQIAQGQPLEVTLVLIINRVNTSVEIESLGIVVKAAPEKPEKTANKKAKPTE